MSASQATAAAGRTLVVNADDFGLSTGVNHGIAAAFEQGIVTSASLMVRAAAAEEAAAYGGLPALGVGLHVDLGEWMQRDGEWEAAYEVVSLEDEVGIADEVERQLDRFVELVERKPTHLDSHQHVHLNEPATSVLRRLAERLEIPLRHFSDTVRYCGAFYGQARDGTPYPEGITTEALIRVVETLPPGITELACHPGDDPELRSAYREERSRELDALCDPRVRKAIVDRGITLGTFADVVR